MKSSKTRYQLDAFDELRRGCPKRIGNLQTQGLLGQAYLKDFQGIVKP